MSVGSALSVQHVDKIKIPKKVLAQRVRLTQNWPPTKRLYIPMNSLPFDVQVEDLLFFPKDVIVQIVSPLGDNPRYRIRFAYTLVRLI